MHLFRLDASIRTEGSTTRRLTDVALAAWQAEHPDAPVVRRDLAASPVPAHAWPAVVGQPPADAPEDAREQALALATACADELEAADAYLFAVPLYNYGVSQHFKAWVDLLLTEPRFAPGGSQLLAGRPGLLVTARGGGYGAGTPRAGWDHATPYLRRVLADILGLDLRVTEAELTLAPVTPGMEALRGLADESLSAAQLTAELHGKELATAVRAAA
jgi:FMN-dependent NADH-azoreductase